jgi:hypothetical protein
MSLSARWSVSHAAQQQLIPTHRIPDTSCKRNSKATAGDDQPATPATASANAEAAAMASLTRASGTWIQAEKLILPL